MFSFLLTSLHIPHSRMKYYCRLASAVSIYASVHVWAHTWTIFSLLSGAEVESRSKPMQNSLIANIYEIIEFWLIHAPMTPWNSLFHLQSSCARSHAHLLRSSQLLQSLEHRTVSIHLLQGFPWWLRKGLLVTPSNTQLKWTFSYQICKLFRAFRGSCCLP